MEHVSGLVVINNGTDGNLDFQILSVAAVAITSFAVASTLGFEYMVVAKLQESVFVNVGGEINVAAIATVSAARTPTRHELLAAEGDATMPSVARFDGNFGFVNERGSTRLAEWK
jgi:arginine exporter protein ArgO